MRNQRKLWCAYHLGKNERGYTLVELLVIISILSIFTSFLSVVIYQIKPVKGTHIQEKYEVSNFFIQFKKDLRTAQTIDIQPNELCYNEEINRVCYKLRGSRLNRTINNSGNNFGLLTVKTIIFTENEVGILLEVWLTNNHYYYTQIFR